MSRDGACCAVLFPTRKESQMGLEQQDYDSAEASSVPTKEDGAECTLPNQTAAQRQEREVAFSRRGFLHASLALPVALSAAVPPEGQAQRAGPHVDKPHGDFDHFDTPHRDAKHVE